jgi:hypothetical protein
VGRRNHYTVNGEKAMRHTAQLGQAIGGLLDFLYAAGEAPGRAAR